MPTQEKNRSPEDLTLEKEQRARERRNIYTRSPNSLVVVLCSCHPISKTLSLKVTSHITHLYISLGINHAARNRSISISLAPYASNDSNQYETTNNDKDLEMKGPRLLDIHN
eukprot:788380_1